MIEIFDDGGRPVRITPGQLGDGSPAAVLEVMPLGHGQTRPVVTLWLCGRQIDDLTVACNASWREAATS